ncbi:hypothetical protein SUGI_0051010 [Cryptomeria japonica]|nr:hypothetical protein SUGI_0051010 [Cryptomeria japonica]
MLDYFASDIVSTTLDQFVGLYSLLGYPPSCDDWLPLDAPPLQVVALICLLTLILLEHQNRAALLSSLKLTAAYVLNNPLSKQFAP